ncbi:MAG: hypothetical protein ACT6U0_02975 [Shinella sp.]|uniref:hypothetical protein n=1 Tax=Rhizobiaceae TaxID=82115 RepID=UPI000A4C7946|nr:hypothetical protein [Rhizobium sp. 9140]
MPFTFASLAIMAAVAPVAATRLWPANDPDEIEHVHNALDPDHPEAVALVSR